MLTFIKGDGIINIVILVYNILEYRKLNLIMCFKIMTIFLAIVTWCASIVATMVQIHSCLALSYLSVQQFCKNSLSL